MHPSEANGMPLAVPEVRSLKTSSRSSPETAGGSPASICPSSRGPAMPCGNRGRAGGFRPRNRTALPGSRIQNFMNHQGEPWVVTAANLRDIGQAGLDAASIGWQVEGDARQPDPVQIALEDGWHAVPPGGEQEDQDLRPAQVFHMVLDAHLVQSRRIVVDQFLSRHEAWIEPTARKGRGRGLHGRSGSGSRSRCGGSRR